ncbi:MAG TPA: hypothetical protein VMT22_20165, partial [Terriglobales bacterium]|nr:hypothetical protein [Terriglobales bacterium]
IKLVDLHLCSCASLNSRGQEGITQRISPALDIARRLAGHLLEYPIAVDLVDHLPTKYVCQRRDCAYARL